jgi:hypothetical protein
MTDPIIAFFVVLFLFTACGVVLLCFAYLQMTYNERILRSRLASLCADERSADTQVALWLDRAALDAIAQLLHRSEWTVDDLDTIADLVRGTGRAIDDCGLDTDDNATGDPGPGHPSPPS